MAWRFSSVSVWICGRVKGVGIAKGEEDWTPTFLHTFPVEVLHPHSKLGYVKVQVNVVPISLVLRDWPLCVYGLDFVCPYPETSFYLILSCLARHSITHTCEPYIRVCPLTPTHSFGGLLMENRWEHLHGNGGTWVGEEGELVLFSVIKMVPCLEAGFIVACLHRGLLEHISNVVNSHQSQELLMVPRARSWPIKAFYFSLQGILNVCWGCLFAWMAVNCFLFALLVCTCLYVYIWQRNEDSSH